MKKLLCLFCFLSLTSWRVYAMEVKVKSVEFLKDQGQSNLLSIKVAGNLNDNPHISIDNKTIQIILPHAHLNQKIKKEFGDINIIANQIENEKVSIKATLPYSLQGKESMVSTTLKEGSVEISFPRMVVYKSQGPKAVNEKNLEAEKFDENYLSALEKENDKKKHVETVVKVDQVKVTDSAVVKSKEVASNNNPEKKPTFSLATYVGKFVAFLSLMIVGFYVVLSLIKKGVIKKGKLGFFHSTKLIEVLNTTHIAPKRSLMMIKAHKQVFLVSNTETGIQLISEINDVAGLVKTGEEELTGYNFDTNLTKANKENQKLKLKLKEDVVASDYTLEDMLNDEDGVGVDKPLLSPALQSINKEPVKDQVKFSDQVKKKLKQMKQIS